MKIALASVMVDDQARALTFYTEMLGFRKMLDIPAGPYRFLTVVSPEAPDGVQLLLEPNANPAGKTFQEAMYAQGIPMTSFAVDDIRSGYERLKGLGVTFRTEPTQAGPAMIAMFEETCGNLIQMHQA